MENGNLILTRLVGESVIIGTGIKVTVAEVRGGKVRLSFSVPKDVQVHRKETWLKIKREAVKKQQTIP